MPSYWVTFVGRSRPGCIEAESAEDARSVAEAKYGEAVATVDGLPYSAFPILHGDGKPSTGFEARCSDPYRCRGKIACPKRPSCSS
jgi:hypothetical protein